MGKRDEARARTTAHILAIARRDIAERGGAALSMRAIAREVGIVSSAIYRYFPTRDALLTAMIVESYGSLTRALDAVPDQPPADRWRGLAAAFRSWASAAPHEFQLIYGTPIPGYAAPPETVPAAAAVVTPFLAAAAGRRVPAFAAPALRGQFAPVAPGDPSAAAAVVAELAALVGVLTLELGGHLVGTADPADELYTALVERQVATLRLASPPASATPAGR